MTTLLDLLLLPLRAPLLLLLLLISTYLGLHWSRPGSWADSGMGGVTDLIWSAECAQALIVVVVCTMPDLLLRRLSSIMAASRVASLVITLLLVVTGGLYLLHLDVLSNVLILGSAVLLARLDLVRLRVVPPPFVMTVALSLLVLGGVSLGRTLEAHIRPYVALPQEEQPAEHRHAASTPNAAEPAEQQRHGTAAEPGSSDRPPNEAARSTQPAEQHAAPAVEPAPASQTPSRRTGPAATTRAGHGDNSHRAPDRAIPHPQGSASPAEAP